MDREILFRGMSLETNCWVYGSLVYSPKECQYYIVEHSDDELSFAVDGESIGQYIGLEDVFGKKIFEGDIVEVTCKFKGKVEFENCGVVEYKGNAFELKIFTDDEVCDFGLWESQGNDESGDTFIIIGNIHDNPELLESDNEKQSI